MLASIAASLVCALSASASTKSVNSFLSSAACASISPSLAVKLATADANDSSFATSMLEIWLTISTTWSKFSVEPSNKKSICFWITASPSDISWDLLACSSADSCCKAVTCVAKLASISPSLACALLDSSSN